MLPLKHSTSIKKPQAGLFCYNLIMTKGPSGFDEFYGAMYGERWPRLKEALLLPKKHVAVLNPFSKFKFPEPPIKISGLSFEHTVGENFPQPEKTEEGYFNYYLMDAASILPVETLDPGPGEKVVDLCAAPGGKSLLCALKLQNKGLLVSNDRSAARRARIHRIFDDYLPKTEQKNHKVTGHDSTKWSLYEKSVYDKVLLDAPCSSERHVLEDSKELSVWAPGRTKAIAISQFAMLASALDIVKVGGTIVYSTCALSQLENDDIIRKLAQKRAGRYELLRPEFSFGEPTEFGWQVLPDNTGWGPFYLAVVKRIR
jgi:16S rRNA C967 or C1407 C5-methylase (RsmB/RsmF family)